MQRVVDLLRTDEMDMAVEPARGQDPALARDGLGPGAHDDIDARLGIGVSGLADRRDPPVPQPHIGLVDAGMVDDQRIGDDRIGRALPVGDLRLSHAVADHLAAAELDLFAIGRVVLLDLDEQIGIRQSHPVARGGAVHIGIGGAGDLGGHGRSLSRQKRGIRVENVVL